MYRHDELPVFGIGKEKDEHFWNSLFRQMLLENIIKKDIEEYGVLKITQKGEAFLKKPASFKIALNNIFEDTTAMMKKILQIAKQSLQMISFLKC